MSSTVVFVDTQLRLIAFREMFRGTRTQASVCRLAIEAAANAQQTEQAEVRAAIVSCR